MKEKTAIVTGGTGYLGREIVRKFSESGYKVYVPSVNLEDFNKVFDKSVDADSENFKLRKIYSFVCDAESETSVNEFIQKVSTIENGKIDVLINTVGGISPAADVLSLTSDALDKMISLNFMSAFYFSKGVLKIMKKNSYGRIISIGAIAGTETTPGRFDYSFAKSGVIRLMDTISEEMKQDNIRCNTVIPSIMDTPANREWGSPDEIKRWVKTEYVADIIYELVSEKFSDIRGNSIKVYGSY